MRVSFIDIIILIKLRTCASRVPFPRRLVRAPPRLVVAFYAWRIFFFLLNYFKQIRVPAHEDALATRYRYPGSLLTRPSAIYALISTRAVIPRQ